MRVTKNLVGLSLQGSSLLDSTPAFTAWGGVTSTFFYIRLNDVISALLLQARWTLFYY